MHKYEIIKISSDDFFKINEDDLMFITNPGRMGDEDGSTFVVKKDNNYIIYRVDGWMYPNNQSISYEDVLKQFPKWNETLHNKNINGKYKHLYAGFGNGLCIDTSIYDEYEPYLNKHVEEYLDGKDDKESIKYAAIFNVWIDALIDMIEDKKKN